MPQIFKDMTVVLAFALVIFQLGKPIAAHFTSGADFKRRRNVWLALTAVAFLSPSFWLFVAVAIPVLLWAARKDSNPVALYLLLLHVVPSLLIPIPTIGIKELFDLDIYRLLSFCILVPFALRLRRAKDTAPIAGLRTMDVFLLAWGALHVLLYVPPDLPGHVILPDSLTNVLRRGLLFLVDVYVLFFAVSRGCADRRDLRDAMAAFCLGCAIMAAVATFEGARHWLLYADLQWRWTGSANRTYLERAGVLRAQASAGHSLALGYLLAIALGFWLYLQTYLVSKRSRFAVAILFCLGLLAAYSRGPWIGAVAIYFAFMAVGPGTFGRIFKAVTAVAVVLGVVSLTPLGDRIFKVLPFTGGSKNDVTVAYRQQLATRSWQLIFQHPFLGDQLAYSKMEDLRQGEGIIDLVNTYAEVTLFYGFIGLFFFFGFVWLALVRAYRTVRGARLSDPDLARLGASLVACILGTMLVLVEAAFNLGFEKMFYVLAGLAAAYSQMRPASAAATAATA